MKLSNKDFKEALNTTAVLPLQILTSALTVAENTTTTTKWETFPDVKLTPGYENVLGQRDILFSRGFTGWE
jgi:hypothetical protein